MRRVIDVETENEGLKEMVRSVVCLSSFIGCRSLMMLQVELIRGEMKRYGASVDAQVR